MQLEPMNHDPLCEVPDDDVCLEPHVRDLSRGYVLSRFRHRDHRNLVVVSSQERLAPRDDMSHHYRRPQRVDDMLNILYDKIPLPRCPGAR